MKTNFPNAYIGDIFMDFLNGNLKKGSGPVDLNLLHKQKLFLVGLAKKTTEDAIRAKLNGYESAERLQESVDYLNGLVCFLDGFMDMLADDLKLWEYPNE